MDNYSGTIEQTLRLLRAIEEILNDVEDQIEHPSTDSGYAE